MRRGRSVFEKVAQLAPQWPDVYYNLGLLLEKTGNYDDAIQNFRTYLQLAPASPDAHQVRETIYKLEYKRERSNIGGDGRWTRTSWW
jgi:lipoprotein NlpI